MNEIYFYRASGKNGFLSNLYKASVKFEGRWFPTSEHAYQYERFFNTEVAEWVMKAPSPRFVALVAHNLLPYDQVRDWKQIKVDRMRRVLVAKFIQHPDLGTRLIDTGDAELKENSKSDGFWGLGKRGNGKNMLGILLMQLRDKLEKEMDL